MINLVVGYIDMYLVNRKQKDEIKYKISNKNSLLRGNYKLWCLPEIIMGTLLFIQYTDDLPLGTNSFFEPLLSADAARI